jgi:hypothetical protein
MITMMMIIATAVITATMTMMIYHGRTPPEDYSCLRRLGPFNGRVAYSPTW